MSAFIKCMGSSKQIQIINRISNQFVKRRVHGTQEVKFEFAIAIDDI